MTKFNSKHFKLEEITKGIYAAIAKDGSGSVGNAGFIDLGGKTVIFDTFNTQQAAEDLRDIAENITKQPVSWVINSHWHGDHIRGNQVFKNRNILSSQTTLQKMKENHPQRIAKQKEDIQGLNNYIASLVEQNKGPNNIISDNKINFLREIARSLPTLELVLPQYTFNKELTIYGTKRTAILMALGGGHSYCDSILYIPEDEIIFMADLLFVETHPTFLPESNAIEWESILNNLMSFEIQKAIPGHGPVGTKEDISKLLNYIKELKLISNENINPDEVPIPAEYKDWASTELFSQNFKMLKES